MPKVIDHSQKRHTRGLHELPGLVKALHPPLPDSPELLFQTQLSHKVGSKSISLRETALWTGMSTNAGVRLGLESWLHLYLLCDLKQAIYLSLNFISGDEELTVPNSA